MKLLIVEDNAEMRRLIVSIVHDLADEIAECADGADALAVYTKFQPDLVLMDLKMPRTDGITASRQIIDEFPNANICVVSDYTNEKTKKAAREAGILNYVAKENLYEIREIIERI
jgi:two-component system response regulator DegU